MNKIDKGNNNMLSIIIKIKDSIFYRRLTTQSTQSLKKDNLKNSLIIN